MIHSTVMIYIALISMSAIALWVGMIVGSILYRYGYRKGYGMPIVTLSEHQCALVAIAVTTYAFQQQCTPQEAKEIVDELAQAMAVK